MRFIFASACLAVAGSLLGASALADSPASLSGKMAGFNYAFGAPWKCTTNIPATGAQPARTLTTTTTFEAAPNNTMHLHIAGDRFMADQYFGYATQGNMYWSSSSDSMGMGMSETSADGKSFKGTFVGGGMTGTVTDTFTRKSDNSVSIHSVSTGAGQSFTSDTTCSR